MNLVEAIDAWIDARIDELTDDDLDWILEIHDAVSASEYVDLETSLVYDDDIVELADQTGGDEADRAYTIQVLRSAFYAEPMSSDLDAAHDEEPTHDPDLTAADELQDDNDDPDLGAAYDEEPADDPNPTAADELQDDNNDPDLTAADEAPQDHNDPDFVSTQELSDSEPPNDFDNFPEPVELDSGTETDETHEVVEEDLAVGQNASFLDDLADATTTDGFMADLASASALDEFAAAATGEAGPVLVRPVELRDGDELGPSFLSSSPDVAQRDPGAWKRWTVTTLLILGLAVFVFGTLQLLGSLSEETDPVAAETPDTATPTPEPTTTPASEPAPAAAAAPVASSEPTVTPTPEVAPQPRVGIRLVTGDIMLATFNQAGEPATLQRIYNAATEDLAPAVDVGWVNDLLVTVDTRGDVLLVNPDTPGAEPTRILEAGDRFGSAVEAVTLAGNLAIRTDNGDIALLPVDGVPENEELTLIWDANEQELGVTDIASDGEFVAFVLDDGTARFVAIPDGAGGAADEGVQIWDAPDDLSAFNIDASPGRILLGIGQGSIARYALEDDENEVEVLWDPADEDDVPATGYASTGDEQVAVVLDDGTLLLIGQDDRITVWDPADTEIAALAAVGDDSQLVVLLETGSVLRVPLDSDFIESVWDITDETLSSANQVTIEPAVN